MRTWNQERPCGTCCGESSGAMASSERSRNEHRVSSRVLRLDRTSTVVNRCVAQSSEPPDADPHVRWCGRGGEVTLPPMPIDIYGSRPRFVFFPSIRKGAKRRSEEHTS